MSGIRLLLESTIEFSLIALAAIVAAALFRRRSAALRHWILSSAVACAAIAPLLGLVVPSWRLPLAAVPPTAVLGAPARSPAIPIQLPRSANDSAGVQAGDDPRTNASLQIVGAVWTAGAALNVGVLLAGMWRLARVRSRSHPIRRGPWAHLAGCISRAYGLRRPVLLLQSDHPTLLVTWGCFRPKVILPRGAHAWSEERARVVLSHELAHISRADWYAQIAAELLRSIHWFNPLAWMMCRALRHESERAADDAVLNAGNEGQEYAEHLLNIARGVSRHGEAWWPAPAIVRSSMLERRITAMLDTHLDRAPLTRSARLVSLAVLLALAAAIASAQGALGTFSGSVLDPMHRTLPAAEVVLTNVQTQTKHEARSDETGRFELSELPPGDYALEVKYPGFMMLRGRVAMSGHNVQQILNLEVGTLQETITVVATSASPPERQRVREAPRRKSEPRSNDCDPRPHGGHLRPPMRLVDATPVYPMHLAAAGTVGTVLLEGVIGKDGTITEVRVVGPAHPDFNAAAVEAVRQWQFDSTLLNCMPIDVVMNVTVNFRTR